MPPTKHLWSYTAGRHGHCVRVYERDDRKNLYISYWDCEAKGGKGAEIKRSLGHLNRKRAQDHADELAGKFRRREIPRRATEEVPPNRTAGRIFDLYLTHRTPDKGVSQKASDRRHAELWLGVLGKDFNLTELSRREWDQFVRDRKSGALSARGNPVKLERRRVRDRTVQKDCAWLRAVCHWATQFREGEAYLLERDPTRGLNLPRERNPSRPVASHDRVDAIRAVYREPRMRRDGNLVESYLPEIFEIAVGTGRRVSAICSLRFEDLELRARPFGAIVWPEDTDKMGKRWRCPISQVVRDAIDAALLKRSCNGAGPLFPSPTDPQQPIGYYKASTWLRAAEAKAGLTPQQGSLWHAYRRLWASARKQHPDVDVARTGGWSSLEALKQAYQQPDDETMLRVVLDETELREVR